MSNTDEILDSINGHRICFKKSDHFNEYVEETSKEIINIMCINDVLERILLECISSFLVSYEHDSYLDFIKRIDKEIKNYPIYIMSFFKFRRVYGELLNSDKLKKMTSEERENRIDIVNKIRGTILELITEKKAIKTNSSYMTGCVVKINGKEIKYKKKKSVDFAGHNKIKCQIFECKMAPDGFETSDGTDQINLLLKLRDELNTCTIRSDLFCVTAGSKSKLEVVLKRMFHNEYKHINAIGGEDLYRTKQFR